MGSHHQGIIRVTYLCSPLRENSHNLKRWPLQGLPCLSHFSPGVFSLMEELSLVTEHPAPDMEHLPAAPGMLCLKILMSHTTIPTMLLLKRMEVWILEESWRSSFLFSSLSSLPSSLLSS